jgi:pyridoxine kinase
MSESLDNHLVHGRRQRPDGPSPIDVISVQSQLVYGHAGNSAAVPPMRALGVRVAEIPTVLLSNAPFYDTTRGRVLPVDWFADLLLGTHERGLPQRAKMLVSGYFGSTANGAAFADWLDGILPACPQLRYCLDPVIGDTHTGPYVEPGLEAVFAERLLPHAWLVTPNAFELNRLTGMPALAETDAIAAARTLLDRGPHWVIATWRWTSPLLPVDVAGTGDVLMSLVVSFLLRGESMQLAISRAIAGTHAALEATLDNGFEEFDVVAAAPAALAEGTRFRAERVA